MPIAKETGSNVDPIPAGMHHAVCYGVIDLGTQQPMANSQYGRPARKVLLMFEVPEERILIEKDGRTLDLPRAISKEFTLSLSEKANLRKFLVAWRGVQFTGEQLKGFDLANVAAANCMLNVVHKENGYADIASVSPLMKGMAKRQPEMPVIVYDIDQFDVPASIPEWVRKKIAASDEHAQAAQNGGRYNDPPPPHEDDDQIPF
jgi:hypothetical protein